MKHTLFLLLAMTALCIAAHGQGNISKHNSKPKSELPQYATAYYKPQSAASKQIQEWHYKVKKDANLYGSVNSERTAFLVPRVTLDSLINSSNLNCDFVVFYIGIDDQNDQGNEGSHEMSLFYTGANYDASGTSISTIPISQADPVTGKNLSQVFDQSFPCPRCDAADLHNLPFAVTGVPVASYFSWVDAGTESYGTILPIGQTNLMQPASQQYVITANNGYSISTLTVDDQPQPITDPTTMTYIFPSTTVCSHEISVKFVQNSSNNGTKSIKRK